MITIHLDGRTNVIAFPHRSTLSPAGRGSSNSPSPRGGEGASSPSLSFRPDGMPIRPGDRVRITHPKARAGIEGMVTQLEQTMYGHRIYRVIDRTGTVHSCRAGSIVYRERA